MAPASCREGDRHVRGEKLVRRRTQLEERPGKQNPVFSAKTGLSGASFTVSTAKTSVKRMPGQVF
ncbi:MAG: hypothetical protein ACUVS3_16145 [Thermodesulfobacteriota bacterium]